MERGAQHARQWVRIEHEQYRVSDRWTEPCGSISVRRVGKRLWRGHLSTICRPRRVYLQVSMIRLFQKKLVGQKMHNLPKTNYDSRVPVVDDFVCVGIFANKVWTIPCRLAEYRNFPRNAFLKCLSSVGAFFAHNCPKIGPLSMANVKVQCSRD